jgi:CRP-like cAMP-binding protein
MSQNKSDMYITQDQEKERLFRDPDYGATRLKEIQVFARFSDAELRSLFSFGKMLKARSKVNIVIEGERTSGLYILMSGRVSVYKTDSATKKLSRIAILEEGASFGELSLFDEAPRSATVVAEVESMLFYLDTREFNRFLEDAGEDLQVKFYKTCSVYLAARFRQLNGEYLNSQQMLWKHALRKEA